MKDVQWNAISKWNKVEESLNKPNNSWHALGHCSDEISKDLATLELVVFLVFLPSQRKIVGATNFTSRIARFLSGVFPQGADPYFEHGAGLCLPPWRGHPWSVKQYRGSSGATYPKKHFSQKSLGTGTVDEILHPTNPIDRLLLACIYIIYICASIYHQRKFGWETCELRSF